MPGKGGCRQGNPPRKRQRRGKTKLTKKFHPDGPNGLYADKSTSIGRRRPGGMGMTGKRKTEKPEVAPFATERSEKNAGEDALFQDPFTPR